MQAPGRGLRDFEPAELLEIVVEDVCVLDRSRELDNRRTGFEQFGTDCRVDRRGACLTVVITDSPGTRALHGSYRGSGRPATAARNDDDGDDGDHHEDDRYDGIDEPVGHAVAASVSRSRWPMT